MIYNLSPPLKPSSNGSHDTDSTAHRSTQELEGRQQRGSESRRSNFASLSWSKGISGDVYGMVKLPGVVQSQKSAAQQSQPPPSISTIVGVFDF